MSFNRLPDDIAKRIFGLFSRGEALAMSTVSKQFLKNIQYRVWKDSGAVSYMDFILRRERLPQSLKAFLLFANYPVRLESCENISRILALSRQARYETLVANYPAVAAKSRQYHDGEHQRRITSDEVIIALTEGLITPAQALNSDILRLVMLTNGLRALSTGVITSQHLEKHRNVVEKLLSEIGWAALNEKLITVEQATAMPIRYLELLLGSRVSLGMLREKLISVQQAAAMPTALHLEMLITADVCREGLRKKRITPEQAALIPEWYNVPKMLELPAVPDQELEPAKRLKL